MKLHAGKISSYDITTEQLKNELEYAKKRQSYIKTLNSTIIILLMVAAVTVLISALLLPVLRVVGSSMEPTLENEQVVVALKSPDFLQGDVIAFYYNNKILLKRVIATEGQKVTVNGNGDVYVDGKLLDEPYISAKNLGECDIKFPYQVPDGRVFVMGDNRETSVDSRSTKIGCVPDELVVGKVLFRVWPLNLVGGI